jgi:hypothetical protein
MLRVISPLNNTVAAKITNFEAIIDNSMQEDNVAVCISFSVSACFPVVNPVIKHFLTIEEDITHTVDIVLCQHNSSDKAIKVLDCTHIFSRHVLTLHPRDNSVAELYFARRKFENVPFLTLPGLVMSYASDLSVTKMAVSAFSGLTSDIHAILPFAKSVEEAQGVCDSMSATRLSCCLRHNALCLPAVAHIGMLIVDKSANWRNVSFIRELVVQASVLNGDLLVLSADTSGEDLLAVMSDSLKGDLAMEVLLDRPSEGVGDPPWRAVLLVDVRGFYVRGDLSAALLGPGATAGGEQEARVQTRLLSSLAASSGGFSFNHGMNTAALTNVCLYRNASTVLLLREEEEGGLLDSALRNKLQSFDFGFHSTDPTGAWKFVERTKSEIMEDLRIDCDSLVYYFRGGSAMGAAPYFPHVVHITEVLLPLVHLVAHPHLYPFATRLERFFFPTVSRGDTWGRAIASLVKWYISRSYGESGGGGDQGAAGMTQHLSTFLRDDTEGLLRELDQHEGAAPLLCFEEALFTGAASESFVSSRAEADAFRAFVYSALDGASWRSDFINIPRDDNELLSSCGNQHLDEITGDSEGVGYLPTADNRNGIRITIATRERSRHMLNLPAMMAMLEREFSSAGPSRLAVDMAWLRTHVVFMETLSFEEQATLARASDILITVHGAALTNGIFMQPGSVVLEVLTSPWYQPFIDVALERFGVRYEVLPQTSLDRSYRCAVPEECLSQLTVLHRSDFSCFSIRQCSVNVDLDAFQMIILKALRLVSTVKRDIHFRRMIDMKKSHFIK